MLKEYLELIELIRNMKKHLEKMDKREIADLAVAMGILQRDEIKENWSSYQLFKAMNKSLQKKELD